MIRNFKALGLAVIAVLAMSAMAASAAQATNGYIETTSGGTVNLHAEDNGTHEFVLTDNSGLATKCLNATFTGSTTNKNSTPVVHPEYNECTAFGLSSKIVTTGCDYEFHITTTITSTEYDGDVDVKCGTGGAIVITTLTCEVKVDPQSLSTVVGTNGGGAGNTMDINLHAQVTGIDYTVTKDGIGCPLKAVGSYTEGDYTGPTTVKGFDPSTGAQVGITLAHP